METVWRYHKILNGSNYEPEIPFLDIYQRIQKTNSKGHMYSYVYCSLSYYGNNLMSNTDDWIRRMWCVYIHNRILLGYQKRNLPFVARWIELKGGC